MLKLVTTMVNRDQKNKQLTVQPSTVHYSTFLDPPYLFHRLHQCPAPLGPEQTLQTELDLVRLHNISALQVQ